MVSLFLFFVFTASGKQQPNAAKKCRNFVYRLCGIVIFVTLVSLLVIPLAAQEFLATPHGGLIGESIMLVAFSVAWLVKAGLPWTWRPAGVAGKTTKTSGAKKFAATKARKRKTVRRKA